ncbi:WD40 repeat domain-containing protein [Sandaracinus amylolyticus]|uniref:WD40 repeat domain-containing protein n=1 Tax=Sandaracinus amylolyticus TaxID=927083 RepID=UPI001F20F0A9|nr:hypothetical protein [Sandaracinus amylolyticus]UJR78511.1 Hypothetical protein I5071_5410 [Sandaracinus amylolyticus]
MTQDDLLERLWTDVIDTVPEVIEIEPGTHGPIDALDLRHVARLARYDAVFSWCAAFDEEGVPIARWLARRKGDRRWTQLVTYRAEALDARPRVLRPDEPFGDANTATMRLHDAGVTGAQLATIMTREGLAALDALRVILREQTFEPGELCGLHESLLTSDPSGNEARPGSWPRDPERTEAVPATTRAPLLELRRAHELDLSPDGMRVVAATGGAITDVATREVLSKCEILANTAHVRWSPDSRWIAAASTSGRIAICDAQSGARARVIRVTSEGTAPVFSADGTVLYAGDWEGGVHAWDVATGRERARRQTPGAMVKVVERAQDGGIVALVSHRAERIELVFLSPELEPIRSVTLGQRIDDVALDPSGHGGALACGHGWVARLDLATGALSDRHELDARQVTYSPDARWCVVTLGNGFRVSASADLSRGTSIEMEYASGRTSFSADSTRIALATWSGGQIWELETLLA